MKFWFDTEFIEDGSTIDLISIGIVADDGREYQAQSADVDLNRVYEDEWLRKNVLSSLDVDLGRKPKNSIASEVLGFVGADNPEFWAYYADYDWVVICQLFGRMVDLPKGWPMYCHDIKQLCDSWGNPQLPEQASGHHNALADARWNKKAWDFLESLKKGDQ